MGLAFYNIPYIEKILRTFKYSLCYGLVTEMGIVPEVSSCPQLGLVEISG